MNRLAPVFAAVITVVGWGCSKPEPETPPAPTAPTPATPPAQTHTSSRSSSASRPTTTGVGLETSLARACGIDQPQAYFEFDSANIREHANDTLDKVATCLTTGPLKDKNILIIGHADPRGTDEYNKQLGQSRAETVANYLAHRGLPQTRMNLVSKGEEGSRGVDESTWAIDRRVDIKLQQ